MTIVAFLCGIFGVFCLMNAIGHADEVRNGSDSSASVLGIAGLILIVVCVVLLGMGW